LNKPLALLIGWIGLRTLFLWTVIVKTQHVYPLTMLQGLMHILVIVLCYQALVSTWVPETAVRVLRAMAWSGVAVMAYCTIQLLSLDQFFMQTDHATFDAFVGTIGNPSHLAAQLAMLLSLFLLQPGWFWKTMAACAGVLLFRTGSAGGQVAGMLVLGWWALRHNRIWLWAWGAGVLVGVWTIATHPQWLNPYGRVDVWKLFYAIFDQKGISGPITGFGPGFLAELSRTIPSAEHPLWQWRHVHNEYFQMAIEWGLIGFFFLAWMIRDLICQVWRLPRTRLVTALGGILLAFGVNSLVNFPGHLWQLGSYALVAYGGIQVLALESA